MNNQIPFILTSIVLFALIACSRERLDHPKSFPPVGSSNYHLTSDISAFLGNFYQRGTTYGQTTEESIAELTYRVSEVLVDGDDRARGYIAVDPSNGELFYFVDVNRSLFEIQAFDFINGDTLYATHIDTLSDYGLTKEFDLLGVLKDQYDIEKAKRKFWGYTDWVCDPCVNNRKTCRRDYYAFWVKQSTQTKCCNPC